jgi:hypothetical protein
MFDARIWLIAPLIIAVMSASAVAQDPPAAEPAKKEVPAKQNPPTGNGEKKQNPPTSSGEKKPSPPPTEGEKKKDDVKNARRSYRGHFETSVLAGGAINTLRLPFQDSLLSDSPQATMVWVDYRSTLGRLCDAQPSGQVRTVSTKYDTEKGETLVGFDVPAPLCWLPLSQGGQLTVEATLGEGQTSHKEKLFDEKVYVTVFWLPLLATLLTLGLIYPGCAAIYWYMRKRNFERDKVKTAPPPTFIESLDPVQVTANPWGRASIGKLQIFLFTMIVFGLLLFHLLRSGVIAAMSTDVMLLLGISAVGAAGGKLAYTANRRLRFENWAWLIRQGWLPKSGSRDTAQRAKWSELFIDSDTREFDPYSFQMAVFSLVVAVALARTSLTGLGTFKIPGELLALLGISQAVFIGGKAMDRGGYRELEEKLDEVRTHEQKLAILKQKQDAKPDDVKAETEAFLESRAQAAQMFAEAYRSQLPDGIPKVVEDAANRTGS